MQPLAHNFFGNSMFPGPTGTSQGVGEHEPFVKYGILLCGPRRRATQRLDF